MSCKVSDTYFFPEKVVEDSNLLGKEVTVRLAKGKIIIEKK